MAQGVRLRAFDTLLHQLSLECWNVTVQAVSHILLAGQEWFDCIPTCQGGRTVDVMSDGCVSLCLNCQAGNSGPKSLISAGQGALLREHKHCAGSIAWSL